MSSVLATSLLLALLTIRATITAASPLGSSYTVQGVNVPVNAPATQLEFDGIEEPLGGALVAEYLYDYPGNPGYKVANFLSPGGAPPAFSSSFHGAGTIFEISLKTASGASFESESAQPEDGWGIAFSNLDFGVAPLTVRNTSMYVIPFQDGAPVPLTLLGAFYFSASGLGPDPLGRPGIPNVLVLPPAASVGRVFEDGMFNFTLEPELTLSHLLTWSVMNFALSQEAPFPVHVDELRVGVILDHDYQLFVPLAPAPGDANGDGYVDGADYTIWADHYLLTGATFAQGDFNNDGIVDGADYTLWADHYSPSLLQSAVLAPEPSSAMLAALGAALIVGAARRGTRKRRDRSSPWQARWSGG